MNVNWEIVERIASIASIAGLLWVILLLLKWAIKAVFGRMKLTGLRGEWYEYHWTNADGPNAEFNWLKSVLTAKPGFFKSYKLRYKNNDVIFQGEARYIDKKDIDLNGDILFKVQQKKMFSNFRETIYFRYNIPERQIGNNDAIAGIWLSYNFGKDITSGASILSKTPIPPDELDAKFDEYFEVNNASIVVKSNNVISAKPSFFRKLINSLR